MKDFQNERGEEGGREWDGDRDALTHSLARLLSCCAPTLQLTVSVNFWYMSPPAVADDIHFPLTAAQKISMMRNIEQMLHTALGSAGEVRDLLRTLVRGRYDTEYNHSLSESGRT